MVDLTGIEPVIPCLQSTRLDSICSIHYRQLLTFPTNRGTCFSLIGILNEMNTLDSCTVRAQTWRRTVRGLRMVLKEKLLSFYAHVGEFSKILIAGGDWRVFGRSGCRD